MMRTCSLRMLMATALASVLAGPASAAFIVSANPGVIANTTGLTGFATSGAGMDGMSVTVFFTNSTSVQLFWADTGATSGGVTGTGWSLSVAGDTFSANAWTLVNNTGLGITRVSLDGTTGQTVFDRTNPNQGTVNSAQGLDFSPAGNGDPFSISAVYSNLLAVIPNAPVGDLYTTLDINFTNTGGFGSGNTLLFGADTDNALTQIIPSNVPAPPSIVMAGFGFGFVQISRLIRRRRGLTV